MVRIGNAIAITRVLLIGVRHMTYIGLVYVCWQPHLPGKITIKKKVAVTGKNIH
jgi:hypothetical protein